jgi:AcrR family transcriptional regulator
VATRSPSQSRSAATRQDIVDAAVDLFVDRGYGDTKLQDIVERAGVTTGAFYYHFDSKAALASAIMAQGWPKALTVIDSELQGQAGYGLERVILMTFALSALMRRDRSVWIANHLNQAFGQLSEEGRCAFESHARQFITRVTALIAPAEIRPDITPSDVGTQVWIDVHGCHLLSDAMRDDVIDRLARSWHILLPATVSAEKLPHLQQFVVRAAAEYSAQQVDIV